MESGFVLSPEKNVEIGRRIKELVKKKYGSRKNFLDEYGKNSPHKYNISSSTYDNYTSGNREISVEFLAFCTKEFNVTSDYILYGNGSPESKEDEITKFDVFRAIQILMEVFGEDIITEDGCILIKDFFFREYLKNIKAGYDVEKQTKTKGVAKVLKDALQNKYEMFHDELGVGIRDEHNFVHIKNDYAFYDADNYAIVREYTHIPVDEKDTWFDDAYLIVDSLTAKGLFEKDKNGIPVMNPEDAPETEEII